MASKFVFNPFTGNFDVVTTAANVCPIVGNWPIYADEDGALRIAPLLLTSEENCITSINGDLIYAVDPYIVP
jgi:hypothetical protein